MPITRQTLGSKDFPENPQKTCLRVLAGKWTKGGARASARAPLWWILKAKTHKNVSGEGFFRVF